MPNNPKSPNAPRANVQPEPGWPEDQPEPGWSLGPRQGTTDRSLRVLFIEDNEDDAVLGERALAAGGYRVFSRRVDSAAAMEAALEQVRWDVILCDCALPGFSAPRALAILAKHQSDPAFVVVSGTIGEEAAAALMKAGAHDYVSKGNLARLAPVVARELADARTRTAHRAAERRLRHLAYHDPVTELPNRNLLFERIEADLRTPHRRLALLSVSVAGLGDVRKTLGVVEADALLRVVAGRFMDAVGHAGLVAYLGSDQFAVLATDADDPAAEELAIVVIDSLRTPLVDAAVRVRSSATAGIALAPSQDDTPDGLLRRAEVAAECARRGGLQTCVYSAELDIYSERRLALLSALWMAAERGELALLYQPKVDLKTGTVGCVEALLRWNRPGQGLVYPDEFIPLAEDSGSIRQLTAWVVNEALRQCAGWRSQGLGVRVAVNLPASGIHDGDIVDWLASQLARHGLPPSALEVEVTEGTLIREPAAARATLMRLRELGVHLAIDDFGSGYSSLAYLRSLPVHSLKIDKSFLTGGLRDGRDEGIVRSAIALAHNLSLAAVAEGVEDEKTFNYLQKCGCDSAQGYFIARPMAPAAIGPWCVAGPWTAQA